MRKRRLEIHTALLICIGTLSLMSFASADESPARRNDADTSSHQTGVQLPTWLWGEWSRDWILRGKSKSSTLDVHSLQTPTYFADLRIPKARAGLSAAKSFADLTDQQLRLLAGQKGFTGLMTLAGAVATWSDEIAFQPYDGTPDTGLLERRPPDGMHEIALDGSYTESWRRIADGSGQFLVVRVEHSGRLLRALVVVGNRFVYDKGDPRGDCGILGLRVFSRTSAWRVDALGNSTVHVAVARRASSGFRRPSDD
jgi:hypothetical protein